jgi:hypothetical protein
MDIGILISFWVMVAVAAAVLAGGTFIYQRLIVARVGASPTAQQAIDALGYWVGLAIFAGEKIVVNALDQAEAYLAGIDKKAVADSLYALIPSVITYGELKFSTDIIKRLVPKEEWQRLVEDAYDKADAFLQANEQFLKDQIASIPKLPAQSPANLTKKTPTADRNVYGVNEAAYSSDNRLPDLPGAPGTEG